MYNCTVQLYRSVQNIILHESILHFETRVKLETPTWPLDRPHLPYRKPPSAPSTNHEPDPSSFRQLQRIIRFIEWSASNPERFSILNPSVLQAQSLRKGIPRWHRQCWTFAKLLMALGSCISLQCRTVFVSILHGLCLICLQASARHC